MENRDFSGSIVATVERDRTEDNRFGMNGGPGEIRTHDLFHAMEAAENGLEAPPIDIKGVIEKESGSVVERRDSTKSTVVPPSQILSGSDEVVARAVWIQIRDGNPIARQMFRRHYSYNLRRDQINLFSSRNRNYKLFAGPGEKLVLLTKDMRGLFVWRKFRSADKQAGVNCAVFRNEDAGLSSDLIRAADEIAWERWPGERHYTYVNPKRVRSSNPGYCFLMAGWRKCGITKARKLIIFERLCPDREIVGDGVSSRAVVRS